MIFKNLKLIFGVSVLGLCVMTSSANAHDPSRVRTINVNRDYVTVVVYQTPDTLLRKRALRAAKRKQVRLTRRLVRASLRH
ncbi:MAG: hypothetical protein JKY84_07430 [Emcibacteraceae bacterium]|nr:hypothetical protein [Emcibacteraceae bacterium]